MAKITAGVVLLGVLVAGCGRAGATDSRADSVALAAANGVRVDSGAVPMRVGDRRRPPASVDDGWYEPAPRPSGESMVDGDEIEREIRRALAEAELERRDALAEAEQAHREAMAEMRQALREAEEERRSLDDEYRRSLDEERHRHRRQRGH